MNVDKNPTSFKIAPVVKKGELKTIDQDKEDMIYWLSMPVPARVAALTFIVTQSLEPGQRMDKSYVQKGKRIIK